MYEFNHPGNGDKVNGKVYLKMFGDKDAGIVRKKVKREDAELFIRFKHGLGDCVQFGFLTELYRRRGYKISMDFEPNKSFVWDVFGVERCDPGDSRIENESWTYPAAFDSLDRPDHEKNKTAYGIGRRTLPKLKGEKQEDLWQEVCDMRIDGSRLVKSETRGLANKFLEWLPRPLALLHSNGTNWAERKNLPADTTIGFIKRWVEMEGGSIVSLDWDHRSPIICHPHVKPILPELGMIDQEMLCALMLEADLMIGVDSGPFHVANLIDVPALGIFRNLHPVRCCVPNHRASYMVSSFFAHHWESRSDKWNFIHYATDEPTPEEIHEAARMVLQGKMTSKAALVESSDKIPGDYVYERVGYDKRGMRLEKDGTISVGGGDAEQRWSLRVMDGEEVLIIMGGMITCFLRQSKKGVWEGRWLRHEQMPIKLRFALPADDVIFEEEETESY